VARTIIDQVVVMPEGIREAEANVPDNLSKLTLRLYRQTAATPTYWTAEVTVRLRIYLSTDNGQTWTVWGGLGGPGGPMLRKDLSEIPFGYMSAGFPDVPDRRIKAEAYVTGGTLTSRLVVEIE